VLADALHLVWAALGHLLAIRAPVFGQDGTHRVRDHYLHLRVPLLQVASHTRYGAAGAGAGHEVRYATLGLLPDLRTRGGVVRLGVGLVVELVREYGVGYVPRHLARLHHVAVRMVRRHSRGRYDHFGAERAQQAYLL